MITQNRKYTKTQKTFIAWRSLWLKSDGKGKVLKKLAKLEFEQAIGENGSHQFYGYLAALSKMGVYKKINQHYGQVAYYETQIQRV